MGAPCQIFSLEPRVVYMCARVCVCACARAKIQSAIYSRDCRGEEVGGREARTRTNLRFHRIFSLIVGIRVFGGFTADQILIGLKYSGRTEFNERHPVKLSHLLFSFRKLLASFTIRSLYFSEKIKSNECFSGNAIRRKRLSGTCRETTGSRLPNKFANRSRGSD